MSLALFVLNRMQPLVKQLGIYGLKRLIFLQYQQLWRVSRLAKREGCCPHCTSAKPEILPSGLSRRVNDISPIEREVRI
jgi:hypothetical protein